MNVIDYIVLIVYFITMVAIGIWSMRKVKGQEDYFMGGRGFGKLLQTFAAFGAGTGAHEPVTVGRTGWTSGLSGSLVSFDVALCHAHLLDHRSLVSTNASSDLGRLVRGALPV